MSTAVAKTYTESERRQAMAVYAFVAGREKQGTELLAEAELEIPWGTICSWVRRNRDEYAQVKAEIDDHTRSMQGDGHRRLLSMAMENEEEILRQIASKLERGEISPRELPKLLQSHGIVSGIHTEKSELLAGHPTSRVASDVGDIEAALQAAGIELIQGDAPQEIESADDDSPDADDGP